MVKCKYCGEEMDEFRGAVTTQHVVADYCACGAYCTRLVCWATGHVSLGERVWCSPEQAKREMAARAAD